MWCVMWACIASAQVFARGIEWCRACLLGVESGFLSDAMRLKKTKEIQQSELQQHV